jgi:tetratricopeptide (TPR) repeat protein
MSIVSLLQKEEVWAQDWYIVASKTRNPEKKIKYYSSAIKFNPNFAAAYLARAGVKHHRFKDYKGAIQDYNKAIELTPKNEPVRESHVLSPNAMAYKYRGDAKKELGDYRGAVEDYTKALAINPK